MGRKLVLAFSFFILILFLLSAAPVSQGATPNQSQTVAQTTPVTGPTAGVLPTTVVEVTRVPSQATPDAGARTFPETGFTVPSVFIKFWDANGGLPVFGYPISEARQEKSDIDGKTYMVQYFERNR
ncbi:MAG: thermitase, partial [Chloroflexia bacterium]|nr:thermitase [Chloroflexia bacterium]